VPSLKKRLGSKTQAHDFCLWFCFPVVIHQERQLLQFDYMPNIYFVNILLLKSDFFIYNVQKESMVKYA
jgi:hypothetical protein